MADIKVEKVTEDGKIAIIDQEKNKTLATLKMPSDWKVKDATINHQKSTLEIPYAIKITLENGAGSNIIIDSGDSFASQGQVAYFHEQIPHTLQHEFITVDKYLDEYVRAYAKQNNKPIRYKEDLAIPLHNYDRETDFIKHRTSVEQETQSAAAASGGRIIINGLYCDSACRSYVSNDMMVVAYTREVGSQASLTNLGMFGGDGMNNMIKELGGLIKEAKDKSVAASKNSDGGDSLLSRIRRRIVAIVTGMLATALLIWAISVTVITVRLSSEGPGLTIVTTEELPSDTIIVDSTIEEMRFDK